MLERQHTQLVSCVQELYQRVRRAGSWEQLLPEDLNRYPSVHDIQAALDLLEPKDDSCRKFETFNKVVGSTQSDDNTPASILDEVSEGQDHYDNTLEQRKSPPLACEDTTSSLPGTSTLKTHSGILSKPLSLSDQSTEQRPGHLEQTAAQYTTSQVPSSQTLAKHNPSQARLFATLSVAPLNRSFYNTSNVPLQYGTTKIPSLSLDPQVIRRDYTSSQQPTAATSSNTLPFCHDWAKSGISLDDSDFSTDFYRFSQLDASMTDVEHAGLVPGTM
jgi:hypothetical protein